jgi:hypothetical protein
LRCATHWRQQVIHSSQANLETCGVISVFPCTLAFPKYCKTCVFHGHLFFHAISQSRKLGNAPAMVDRKTVAASLLVIYFKFVKRFREEARN